MSTLRSISEQISRLYSRSIDKENNHTKLNWKEVKPLVSQKINEIMGAQLINFKGTDIAAHITSGMIMKYNVSVLTRGSGEDQEWYSRLPVYPVRLPHSQGIYRVGPRGAFKRAYIIVPECYWDLLEGLEDFQGNTCVVPLGDNELLYSEDPGVTQVIVSLIVNDTGNFGDNDVLPITAEIEAEVIKRVLELFQPERIQPKEVTVKTVEGDDAQ
jgi:hypothetical protein